MLLRQVIPLLFLYANNGGSIYGRTRFQKMIFLAQKEEEGVKEWYNFYPHDFGPYSTELQNDLDILAMEGLIRESPEEYGEKIRYQYLLTRKGTAIIEKVLNNPEHRKDLNTTLKALTTIKSKYSKLPLEKLINHVYLKYPEYAIFSKFTNY
ncbi:Uncharacterised protein [uncultured archaeon]|nr:Uncharacterised protein [uncultured archaeon]